MKDLVSFLDINTLHGRYLIIDVCMHVNVLPGNQKLNVHQYRYQDFLLHKQLRSFYALISHP